MFFLTKKQSLLGFLFVLFLFLGVACSPAGGLEPAAEDDTVMEEMEHDDHDLEVIRIPNENGAAIRITSPEDGATFSAGEQVVVEVEVENFDLGVNGNHWHVYIDGSSWGMVMGENTDQPLSGLEPGEREISVFMSIDTHEEYEDGDSVTITVAE